MHSGELSWSLSTGWLLYLPILWTFHICVRPPSGSFEEKASAKGALSDNWNVALPAYCKSGQDGLTNSSVSEIYPTAAICVFWVRESFRVWRRFRLPCHISEQPWTLAIWCDLCLSASLLISEPFSWFILSNAGSPPANIPVLAPAHYVTMTFWWRVLPLDMDSLQPISPCPREKQACDQTACGMIEQMSCATLERSAYTESISSCCCHQSMMSDI